MDTQFLDLQQNPQALRIAADLLINGQIVAFPTETVFGIGASVLCNRAIDSIYKIKGRPKDKPLSIHLADIEQIHEIGVKIPDFFWNIAQAFLPGPLTIILPKKKLDVGQQEFSSLGIRVPDHPLCRDLIKQAGPILATSANFSSEQDLVSPIEVFRQFQGKIAAVLSNGKNSFYERPSTVITFNDEGQPLLLREGVIEFSKITAVSSQYPQMPV